MFSSTASKPPRVEQLSAGRKDAQKAEAEDEFGWYILIKNQALTNRFIFYKCLCHMFVL